MRRVLALTIALAAMMALAVPASAGGNGATQVSGIGKPGGAACTEKPYIDDADYTILMEGDLVGCVYGDIIEKGTKGPGPSGIYKERADEIFVGSYNGLTGTFRMTENFHGKFDLATGNELFGFCKHPIVRGSGTGELEGVRGRLDFRDDVTDPAKPLFPYKGHLKNLD